MGKRVKKGLPSPEHSPQGWYTAVSPERTLKPNPVVTPPQGKGGKKSPDWSSSLHKSHKSVTHSNGSGWGSGTPTGVGGCWEQEQQTVIQSGKQRQT